MTVTRRPFTAPRTGRFSKADRQELEDYVKYYTDRGCIGMWTEHAQAIRSALREIDRLRRQTKSGGGK